MSGRLAGLFSALIILAITIMAAWLRGDDDPLTELEHEVKNAIVRGVVEGVAEIRSRFPEFINFSECADLVLRELFGKRWPTCPRRDKGSKLSDVERRLLQASKEKLRTLDAVPVSTTMLLTFPSPTWKTLPRELRQLGGCMGTMELPRISGDAGLWQRLGGAGIAADEIARRRLAFVGAVWEEGEEKGSPKYVVTTYFAFVPKKVGKATRPSLGACTIHISLVDGHPKVLNCVAFTGQEAQGKKAQNTSGSDE